MLQITTTFQPLSFPVFCFPTTYLFWSKGKNTMEIQKLDPTSPTHTPREIKVGTIYKHYSGKMYKVIALAHDSEDPSLMRVIYQGLYECPTFGLHPIWDRSYAMFAENVVINGKEQPRFEEVV